MSKHAKRGLAVSDSHFIELVKMRGRILILSLIVLAYAAEEPTIDRAKNAAVRAADMARDHAASLLTPESLATKNAGGGPVTFEMPPKLLELTFAADSTLSF